MPRLFVSHLIHWEVFRQCYGSEGIFDSIIGNREDSYNILGILMARNKPAVFVSPVMEFGSIIVCLNILYVLLP